MIAVDTNVLVRYFFGDENTEQQAAAVKLIGQCSIQNPALVVSGVLAEFVWVLRTSYQIPKAEIVDTLAELERNPVFEDEHEFIAALNAYRDRKADFADCLIAARSVRLGASTVFTFDRIASRKLPFQPVPTGA